MWKYKSKGPHIKILLKPLPIRIFNPFMVKRYSVEWIGGRNSVEDDIGLKN